MQLPVQVDRGQYRRKGAQEPVRPWESYQTPRSPELLVSQIRMRLELHAGPFPSKAHGTRLHVGSQRNRMPPREAARNGRLELWRESGSTAGQGGLASHWAGALLECLPFLMRACTILPELDFLPACGAAVRRSTKGPSTMPGTE